MINTINEVSNFKRVGVEVDNRAKGSQQPNEHENESLKASQVNLSNTSKQISALKELISKVPDINQARIEAIKNEVDSGQYKIEAKQVAARLLEEMQQ